MSDKIFIDSNLLIYSIDDGEPVKRLTAKRILKTLAKNGGVISTSTVQSAQLADGGSSLRPRSSIDSIISHSDGLSNASHGASGRRP